MLRDAQEKIRSTLQSQRRLSPRFASMASGGRSDFGRASSQGTGLVVHEQPLRIDAPKPVGGHEPRSADQLDADDPSVVPGADERLGAQLDLVLHRVAEDLAVGGEDRLAADERRPTRMDAGNAILRPEARHLLGVVAREGRIIGLVGGAQRLVFRHVVILAASRPKSGVRRRESFCTAATSRLS